MSSLYGRIFARVYDPMFARIEDKGLREARRGALSNARGRVLEIGAGTGANADLYPAGVEVVMCEPEEPMAVKLEEKYPERQVVRAGAERLPFDDDAFDTVVSTLVLCTVGDLDASLREIARVLKPDGVFVFLEHVRDDANPSAAKWQDRIAPLWKPLGHGCNLNRSTVPAIEAAGFRVEAVGRPHVPMPKLARPVVSGRATAPAPAPAA